MMKRWLLLFASLFWVSVSSAQDLDQIRPNGAVCLVKVDGKLLVTSEIITGKLSLPGGSLDPTESPEEAAMRELYEEVGIKASVSRLLLFSDKYSFLYECLPSEPVTAFTGNNLHGGHIVPIHNADHYGVETKSAMLLPVDLLSNANYRYPKHIDSIRTVFPSLIDTPAVYVDNVIEESLPWQQWSLAKFEALTRDRVLYPFLLPIAQVVEVFVSPLTLLLILPWLYWRFGRMFALEVMFVVSATTLLCTILQYLIAQPLPLAFVPSWGSTYFYGFSFPNAHVAAIFAVAILFKHRLIWGGKAKLLTFMGLLCFSELLLGKAFLSDMLIGAVIGLGIGSIITNLEHRRKIDLQAVMSSWQAWAAMLVTCGIALWIWQVPVLVDSFVMLTTLSLLVRLRIVSEDSSHLVLSEVLKMSIALGLVFICLIILKASIASHSLLALIYDSLVYPCLFLVLVIMLPKRKTKVTSRA
jgi:8-oxo-dGTP pyrophosphatase MutT (NUDIX family)